MKHISGWLLTLPFLAGAVLLLQAGINGQLARHLSSVFAAALVVAHCRTLNSRRAVWPASSSTLNWWRPLPKA